MKVQRPIIIFSIGRSGSTIFFDILSKYNGIYYLSPLNELFPTMSFNKYVFHLRSIPFIWDLISKSVKPFEAFKFWERYIKGFSTPHRDLNENDITPKELNRIRKVFSKQMPTKKYRLAIKITGWPRIGLLKSIFPDAKFIHILRDGRAVANSMINVPWWWGWRGPQNWRFGELKDEYRDEWEKHEQSFIALAGIEWKIILDAVEDSKKYFNESNFMEIKYEDLCKGHVDIFRDVFDFCELEWTQQFENKINKIEMKNTNFKWEKELNETQKYILNSVTEEYLRKYDYL